MEKNIISKNMIEDLINNQNYNIENYNNPLKKNYKDNNLILITVTKSGFVKKTYIDNINNQLRGGVGSIFHKIDNTTDDICCLSIINTNEISNATILELTSINGKRFLIYLNKLDNDYKYSKGYKIKSLDKDDEIINIDIKQK